MNVNLPTVFLSSSSSMLITKDWLISDVDDRIHARSTKASVSLFDTYSFLIVSMAACDWHQIHTIAVFLSTRELSISMPSSFSSLMSFSFWCDLGLVLFWRSSIVCWSDLMSPTPRFWTWTFTTTENLKKVKQPSKLLARNSYLLQLNRPQLLQVRANKELITPK